MFAISRFAKTTAISVTVFSTILGASMTTIVRASDNKHHVSGTITLQAGNTNCASPVHICDDGTVTGDIKGKFYNVLQTLTYVKNADGTITSATYIGNVTITTKHGQLFGILRGTVELPSGTVEETIQITGGTENHKNARGLLNMEGQSNLNTGSEIATYKGHISTSDDDD